MMSHKSITKHQWLAHMGTVTAISKLLQQRWKYHFYVHELCFHLCCHSLEVLFSLLKKGVSQYFCPYKECTSHWCLVRMFVSRSAFKVTPEVFSWDQDLAFCRPDQFFHTDWIIIYLWSLPHTQRHCHVRKGSCPNCCYTIWSTQFPRISLYA